MCLAQQTMRWAASAQHWHDLCHDRDRQENMENIGAIEFSLVSNPSIQKNSPPFHGLLHFADL